jgi:hypothetical protein
MAPKTYRLKIGEFEAEGDKAFVSEMLKRYGPQASAEIATRQKAEQGGGVKRTSAVTRSQFGSLSSSSI